MASFLVMIGIFIVSNGFALALLYPMHLHPLSNSTASASEGGADDLVSYTHEEIIPGKWMRQTFPNGTEYWLDTMSGNVEVTSVPGEVPGGWIFTKFQATTPLAEVVPDTVWQMSDPVAVMDTVGAILHPRLDSVSTES